MALRDRLKRLERQMREGHQSCELVDGSRYYYDIERAQMDLFRFMVRAWERDAEDVPEPEFLIKARQAKDTAAALERLRGDGVEAFPIPLDLLEEDDPLPLP